MEIQWKNESEAEKLVSEAEEGELQLRTQTEDDDILYDEIGSVLKIKQLQREKEELFESLEMYYRVFYLGEAYEGEE